MGAVTDVNEVSHDVARQLDSVKRSSNVGILPGPETSLKDREARYGVKFDSVLSYQVIGSLSFKKLKSTLKSGHKVQLVIEFNDNFDNIKKGKYDKKLKDFGAKVKEYGQEITIRALHEFNGSWYPWCVYSPDEDNSIDKFKSAYKHIVKVLRGTGGKFRFQLSWAMRNGLKPGSKTERYDTPAKDFYGGLSSYVDELCVSAYNLCGAKDYTEGQKSLETVFQPWYDQFKAMAPDKAICIAEMGSTGHCGGKGDWFTAAWDAITYKFTLVRTMNWFFEDKPKTNRDWDLKTDADIKAFANGFKAFKAATGGGRKHKTRHTKKKRHTKKRKNN